MTERGVLEQGSTPNYGGHTPHGGSCSLLVQTLQAPEHAIPSVNPVSCWMPQTRPVHSVPDLQRACMHQPQEFLISPCHPQLISRVHCRLPVWESCEASHGTAAEVLCDPSA